MYTVMLLDDEPWALESLFRVVPWEQHGFSVIGRFTDPIAGWEAIVREQPAVVFIDVQMPELTGLEMAQRAKALRHSPLFIVVSGYSSFQYAQTALRLGVFDYCLKPVEREDAQALLGRIAGELKRRQTRKSIALLEEIQSGLSANELFERLDMPTTGDWWRVAVLRYVDEPAAGDVASRLSSMNAHALWLGQTKTLIVANGLESVGEELEAAVDGCLAAHTCLRAGLSRTSRRADHLWRRIYEARSCAYMDFVDPTARKTVYRMQESAAAEACVAALEDAIARRDLPLWEMKLREYAQRIERERVQMHSLCRHWNRLMDAFSRADGAALCGELEWAMDPEGMRSFLADAREMIAYLDALMRRPVEAGPRPGGAGRGFEEMLDYVQRHYTDKIRLSDLAARFYLNAAYCSEVFRKAAGMTYTDYVTKLRMEHALAAIRAGECNLQALALELGYGDYFTFSKRFKSYFGQSPSKMDCTKKS